MTKQMSDEELRDKLASESVKRYNHSDSWIQHEMRKCGELSYVEGWNKARENDEQSEYLKNQVSVMREAFMQFQSTAQETFDAAIHAVKQERDQLRAEVDKLKKYIGDCEYDMPTLRAEVERLKAKLQHAQHKCVTEAERDALKSQAQALADVINEGKAMNGSGRWLAKADEALAQWNARKENKK